MIRKYFGISARRYHVFSRETIKPSIPTPSHLKRYNLSSLDRIMFPNYMPIVFFFPNDGDDSQTKKDKQLSQLKHSLSKTLAQYYPFAGRLTSGGCVNCNDNGVEFQEARIQSKLSEFLEKHKDVVVPDLVFPLGLEQDGFYHDSSLMVVKLNHFDCGGIAIAVCLSHKVADACTFSTFMAYWASVTRQSGEQVSPYFISSPSNDQITQQEIPPRTRNFITRRFVFHNSKITHLKTMASSSGIQNPTQFEVLVALLYKCAMTAAKSSSSGSSSPSVLFCAVNMRSKMVPPLPKTTLGNFVLPLSVPTTTENGSNLNSLIDQIKKGKMQLDGAEVLDGDEAVSTMSKFGENNYKVYFCSSLCNFDLYKVDFGWGKPARVVFAGPDQFSSSIYFMETPSGNGIEALVSLDEQDMVTFELDKELLALASLH
ncbi:hypothetical protein LguiB_002088 [Lonicera macranthoides]